MASWKKKFTELLFFTSSELNSNRRYLLQKALNTLLIIRFANNKWIETNHQSKVRVANQFQCWGKSTQPRRVENFSKRQMVNKTEWFWAVCWRGREQAQALPLSVLQPWMTSSSNVQQQNYLYSSSVRNIALSIKSIMSLICSLATLSAHIILTSDFRF